MILYSQIIYGLIEPAFNGIEWIAIFIIPFFFLASLLIFWFINTNRYSIKKSKKFVLGLILKIDDNETEYKIKKIVKACTKEINNEFKDIEIKVFPINFKDSKAQVEIYLKNRSLHIDAILYANVESGRESVNGKIEEKILINEFSFIGNLNVHENRQIFNSTVNLAKDLSIRNIYKDWAYIEDNSLNDKRKIKANFRDTILHYTGIYLIYLSEFQLSLKILKSLFNKKLSRLPKAINARIRISKEILAAGRLNNIILNLFLLTAIKTYRNTKDSLEAYRLLKDCEKLFYEHPDSYFHYIPLARFAYENGNIEEAKQYTFKAKKRKGETFEVLVNLAFFAIIEENIYRMTLYYRKILNKISTESFMLNAADLIEFLERQKNKYSEKAELFDFAIGFLNKLFLDTNLGHKQLIEFIEEYDSYEKMSPLINLAKETVVEKNDTIVKAKKTHVPRNSHKRRGKRRR